MSMQTKEEILLSGMKPFEFYTFRQLYNILLSKNEQISVKSLVNTLQRLKRKMIIARNGDYWYVNITGQLDSKTGKKGENSSTINSSKKEDSKEYSSDSDKTCESEKLPVSDVDSVNSTISEKLRDELLQEVQKIALKEIRENLKPTIKNYIKQQVSLQIEKSETLSSRNYLDLAKFVRDKVTILEEQIEKIQDKFDSIRTILQD